MSKGLEALERLKHNIDFETYYSYSNKDDLLIIEKEHKALEIIKNKFDMSVFEIQGQHYLLLGKNFRYREQIAKEEYDLLKEVLLWD